MTIRPIGYPETSINNHKLMPRNMPGERNRTATEAEISYKVRNFRTSWETNENDGKCKCYEGVCETAVKSTSFLIFSLF
jgi:hypothetical protein